MNSGSSMERPKNSEFPTRQPIRHTYRPGLLRAAGTASSDGERQRFAPTPDESKQNVSPGSAKEEVTPGPDYRGCRHAGGQRHSTDQQPPLPAPTIDGPLPCSARVPHS